MIDWNNDGDIDVNDLIMTEVLLEDDEKEENRVGSEKPNGNCLSVVLLVFIPPILLLLSILN